MTYNWFSSVSTHSSPPTTRILVSQFPPARLKELILHSRDDPPAVYLSCSISQSPAFSWGRSELTDRNVELYPQFFLELITTQLRFYMVSPQLSLLTYRYRCLWLRHVPFIDNPYMDVCAVVFCSLTYSFSHTCTCTCTCTEPYKLILPNCKTWSYCTVLPQFKEQVQPEQYSQVL